MQNSKRLTLNGLTGPHLIFILLCVAMIGVSVYLTKHFYQVHFPQNIQSEDTLCEISSFWGCAKASTSFLGSIFHVPTSFFGIIVGLVGIFGGIFASEENERFSKLVIYLNAIGCVILLTYSLIALHGLCPFCTVYYVLSFLAAFLFYKNSSVQPFPEVKPFLIYFIMTLVPGLFMFNYYLDNMKQQTSLSSQYVKQYQNLATPGDPITESPFKIHMGTKEFASAPLRITIFSDFECPFCKVVAEQMRPLINEFKDKINIQYMFYPLDNACNPNIKSSFHQHACKAAYLAACDKSQFATIHDVIFSRQEQLSFENLTLWEKEFGLSECFKNKQVQDEIMQTINAGNQYNLKSTPTMIVNGKKLEGSIPTIHLKAILNSLLEQN